MQPFHFIKRITHLVTLLFMLAPIAPAWAIAEVTLQFMTHDGNGFVAVINPTIGVPTLSADISAKWLLKPDTQITFKIQANISAGDLVFELCKRNIATGVLDRVPAGSPLPVSPDTGVVDGLSRVNRFLPMLSDHFEQFLGSFSTT